MSSEGFRAWRWTMANLHSLAPGAWPQSASTSGWRYAGTGSWASARHAVLRSFPEQRSLLQRRTRGGPSAA